MGAQWKAKGKELAANAKGKLFGRLAKDIMIAARSGADPASNSRLRLVVEQARKVSMPKETLDRAIKKGAGLTGQASPFFDGSIQGLLGHGDFARLLYDQPQARVGSGVGPVSRRDHDVFGQSSKQSAFGICRQFLAFCFPLRAHVLDSLVL